MHFLDIFFTVFHTLLILFILFGWLWKKTRKLNLICILLTAASWLILGIFYGIGYCPLTDWHFQVLESIGHTGLPSSYISFLVTRLSGLNPNQGLVDAVTAWGLVVALIMSVILNFKPFFSRIAARILRNK